MNNQQVDHKAEAQGLLRGTEADMAEGNYSTVGVELAKAHASLAIVEQLERLNDQLAEVIDPTAGGGTFPGVVRVRTEGTEG